jgi:hypothetical protein
MSVSADFRRKSDRRFPEGLSRRPGAKVPRPLEGGDRLDHLQHGRRKLRRLLLQVRQTRLFGVRVNQHIRFPSNVFRFLLPHLLALPTEAWRGAESRRRSAENVYIDLHGPHIFVCSRFIFHHCTETCSYIIIHANKRSIYLERLHKS